MKEWGGVKSTPVLTYVITWLPIIDTHYTLEWLGGIPGGRGSTICCIPSPIFLQEILTIHPLHTILLLIINENFNTIP